MTQAIGRAYRMGQLKPVHIYHFLMAKTIEVNIIQDREKKAIAKQNDGTFRLEERTNSEPTAWEGPDMQGAASGAGNIDMAEIENETDVKDKSDAGKEAGDKHKDNDVDEDVECYHHDRSVCIVCNRPSDSRASHSSMTEIDSPGSSS